MFVMLVPLSKKEELSVYFLSSLLSLNTIYASSKRQQITFIFRELDLQKIEPYCEHLLQHNVNYIYGKYLSYVSCV